MNRTIAVFLCLFPLVACSQRLIEKERLKEINAAYEDRVFVLKEDVQISSTDSIKAGVPVRIYIESTPTLLKIKCYPANETRESSFAKLAYYLINEQAGKKVFLYEDVDALVKARFDEWDPQSKKPPSKKKDR